MSRIPLDSSPAEPSVPGVLGILNGLVLQAGANLQMGGLIAGETIKIIYNIFPINGGELKSLADRSIQFLKKHKYKTGFSLLILLAVGVYQYKNRQAFQKVGTLTKTSQAVASGLKQSVQAEMIEGSSVQALHVEEGKYPTLGKLEAAQQKSLASGVDQKVVSKTIKDSQVHAAHFGRAAPASASKPSTVSSPEGMAQPASALTGAGSSATFASSASSASSSSSSSSSGQTSPFMMSGGLMEWADRREESVSGGTEWPRGGRGSRDDKTGQDIHVGGNIVNSTIIGQQHNHFKEDISHPSLSGVGEVGRRLGESADAQLSQIPELNFYVQPFMVKELPTNERAEEWLDKATGLSSIAETTQAFLGSDDQVLVLFGEPGSGKTLTSWHILKTQLAIFKQSLEKNAAGEAGAKKAVSEAWLPLRIDCKTHTPESLKKIVSREISESLQLPPKDASAALRKLMGFESSAQPEPKILLIVDGFDELRSVEEKKALPGQPRQGTEIRDLYALCMGQDWRRGRLKVVVTCRSRYLPDRSDEERIFGRGERHNYYQRHVLLPFTSDQIADYIRDRAAVTNPAAGLLLPAKAYADVLAQNPAIKGMVRNPFVLRLYVEALPYIKGAGQIDLANLTRYQLYEGFAAGWFEREIKRLPPVIRNKLGRQKESLGGCEVDDNMALAGDFDLFAEYLAMSMFNYRTLTIQFDEAKVKAGQQDVTFAAWDAVVNEYYHISQGELARLQEQKPTSCLARFKAPVALDKDRYLEEAGERLRYFYMTSPLNLVAGSYSFIHKSFYEFYIAKGIVHLLQKYSVESKPMSLSPSIAGAEPLSDEKILGAACKWLGQRPIQQEPEVLAFFREYWESTEERRKQFTAWSALLSAIVISSREAKEDDRERLQSSANALTLLAQSGCRLPRRDFRGVKVPGADLSYSNLAYCNFQGANLRGATLTHTVLYHVDLKEANLCEVEWGELPYVQLVKNDNIEHIAYHPQQDGVVACSIGKKIVLYDIRSGDRLGPPLVGHAEKVTSIAFSREGKYLVSASRDRTLRRWDMTTQPPTPIGKPLLLPKGKTDVIGLAFRKSDGHIVSLSQDGTLWVWDASTDACSQLGKPPKFDNENFYWKALSPDGLRVVFTLHMQKGGLIFLLNIDDKQKAALKLLGIHPPMLSPASVAFSWDGRLVASGGVSDKAVRLWNVELGKPIGTFTGCTSLVNSLAFSPDNRYLVAWSDDQLRIWDLNRQNQPVTFSTQFKEHAGEVTSVAVSAHGSRLWVVSAGLEGTIRLWDALHQTALSAPLDGHKRRVTSVAFSSNGDYVVSGSWDKTLLLWDAKHRRAVAKFIGHTVKVNCVAFRPNGKHIISGGDDGLRLWDIPEGFTLSPSGQPVSEVSNSVILSRPDQHKKPLGDPDRFSDWGKNNITEVAISPVSPYYIVVAASSGGSLHLWDIDRRAPLGTPVKEQCDISGMAFSPDGQRLVSGSRDHTLCLWFIQGQQLVLDRRLTGHSDQVTGVAFSSDSRRVVSGSRRENNLRLWDVNTGQCLAVMHWHQTIESLVMIRSPMEPSAEDWLVMGDEAGTLSFWTVSRTEPTIRFLGMPRHSAMPLLVEGVQLSGCQMSTLSRRSLEQRGADVRHVKLIDQPARRDGTSLFLSSTESGGGLFQDADLFALSQSRSVGRRPKESVHPIESEIHYLLQDQKLIPFRRKTISPDGNCLFHSMAEGIKKLPAAVRKKVAKKLKEKERSNSQLTETGIDDQLLRSIAVKLLNEKVQDAKLSQNLVEQGLIPLVTLEEKEYEDVVSSIQREDKGGKLQGQLNSIRTAVAEVPDETAYQALIEKEAMAWAQVYRDLLGIPGVWGGPVELQMLEDYLSIRFDIRQQLNLGPLPERSVKYKQLQQWLREEKLGGGTRVTDRIRAELKTALGELIPLDDDARIKQVGSVVMKLLESVLRSVSKKNALGVDEMETTQLDSYLITPAAIELYGDWFLSRKIPNSQLEQEIHDYCLMDKYRQQGLTQQTLKLIQQKGIALTKVYCPYYHTPRLEEVAAERRIQVVYTGTHYDMVEPLPGVSPIALKEAEVKAGPYSALPLSPPAPSSAGGGHPSTGGTEPSRTLHYSGALPSALGSSDKILLWDVSKQRLATRFTEHTESVECVRACSKSF